MKIRAIIYTLSLALGSFVSAQGRERPNIILILAKELKREHLECYGGKHPSPNIDRLAREGVRYETAWRMPDGNLSMKTLLSGRYPCHYHDAPSFPDLLEKSGYRTGTSKDQNKSFSLMAKAGKEQPFLLIHHVGAEGTEIDQQVGKLITAIDESEFKENTVVILTSEGGTEKMKSDRGVHAPFIVRAPFLIKGGRVSKDLVDFTDILPTLLSLAGIENIDALKSDGKSMVPSLKGSDDPFEKRNWICSESEGFRMVRDWQHILDTEGNFHDLRSDPRQAKEVSPLDKQAPGRRTRLQMMLDRFL